MTDDWKSAKLSIKASQLPWQQVQEKVADLWREVQGMVGDLSSGVGKHYLITQSFESLEFRQLKELPSLADTFSGRVFNKMAEVRWLRTDDKALIWLYHEAANGELECESFDRKYYLWGEWDNKGKTDEHGSYFVEGRMPKSRQYPVVATKEHERAYIMVREYRPAKPVFAIHNLDELAVQLNQPRLVAHRFLYVDVSGGEDA